MTLPRGRKPRVMWCVVGKRIGLEGHRPIFLKNFRRKKDAEDWRGYWGYLRDEIVKFIEAPRRKAKARKAKARKAKARKAGRKK